MCVHDVNQNKKPNQTILNKTLRTLHVTYYAYTKWPESYHAAVLDMRMKQTRALDALCILFTSGQQYLSLSITTFAANVSSTLVCLMQSYFKRGRNGKDKTLLINQ